jgi:hypothetical protein
MLLISSNEDLMAIQMFVFLLVFFLLLGLARLWHLSWPHLQPSHSQGGALRTTVQRLRHRHAPRAIALPVASPAPPRRL